jgi:ABC-type transporter Mla MlaB component
MAMELTVHHETMHLGLHGDLDMQGTIELVLSTGSLLSRIEEADLDVLGVSQVQLVVGKGHVSVYYI